MNCNNEIALICILKMYEHIMKGKKNLQNIASFTIE
jgi:hypothetical protein